MEPYCWRCEEFASCGDIQCPNQKVYYKKIKEEARKRIAAEAERKRMAAEAERKRIAAERNWLLR